MLRHGAFFGVLFAADRFRSDRPSQAPFEWLFAVSNIGRVLGGILGARLASGTSGSL